MDNLQAAAREFLSHRRLAVAGVSRKGDTAANGIYRSLRTAGYRVFAVNPNSSEVEGDPCYASVGAVPGGVDGVIVATHPDAAADVVLDCARAGVGRVWLHRAFGSGSVSDDAVRLARAEGLDLIDGACPLMYLESADPFHRVLRWFLKARGRLPRCETYVAE